MLKFCKSFLKGLILLPVLFLLFSSGMSGSLTLGYLLFISGRYLPPDLPEFISVLSLPVDLIYPNFIYFILVLFGRIRPDG